MIGKWKQTARASLLAGIVVPVCSAQMQNYYRVEDIATPAGVVPECQGLDFTPAGQLAAVFDHGEACFYNPATKAWRVFAQGLHTPMGVMAISDRELIVCQKAELTRLLDRSGSGTADRYECICDAWGLSGNYDEFDYGPVRDAHGNFYVALGCDSAGKPVHLETRGTFNPHGADGGKNAMASLVPYRGWVVKILPSGTLVPLASGFRQPAGLVIDPEGRLLVTDNQGDWVGTSKLHWVLPGRFYGHAASLAWRSDLKTPLPLPELDRMRTEGVVLFPHAIVASSPGQPLFDRTGGKFGPYAGQLFVTEFNTPRLLRVMFDEVHGQLQGSAAIFFDGAPLHTGNLRIAFAPDGALWCAQTERRIGWPGGSGIQRLSWSGQVPMDILETHLTETGFRFVFTKRVDPASLGAAEALRVTRYYYLYHSAYGSPRVDIHAMTLRPARVAADGKTVSVDLDGLLPGYIYEWRFGAIKAADGTPIATHLLAYTANTLLDGSRAPIPRPVPTGRLEGGGSDRPPGSTM